MSGALTAEDRKRGSALLLISLNALNEHADRAPGFDQMAIAWRNHRELIESLAWLGLEGCE